MKTLMPLRRDRGGQSLIEVTFMAPWILFLFVGVFDMGFFAYALISTENAARAAAVHNSISTMAATDPDSSGCKIVIAELQWTANARTLTDCSSQPNVLSVVSALCPDDAANCTEGSPDGNHAALVKVTYTTDLLIPIPGLLPGQLKITRKAWMRVNSSADLPSN